MADTMTTSRALPPNSGGNAGLSERENRAAGVGAALLTLTKPRQAFFSLLTAMAGYAAAGAGTGGIRFGLAMAGIALSTGGALALNQWWEAQTDSLMDRTRGRPIPSGVISPGAALGWSVFLAGTGAGLLFWLINPLTAWLTVAAFVLYGLIYTPMKRVSRWATEVGAVPGAMPPLLGAAAAGDPANAGAWVLVGILFFWQMPHFYGIGWVCRLEYRAAGFPLLPAVDRSGRRTARWALAHALLLAVASLLPWAAGWLGPVYGLTALIGAVFLLTRVWGFHRSGPGRRDRAARRLFWATILYLPPVMAALVFECW